ncbi:hypothetical protein AB4K20DRAFT_1886275 [Rhizopus microsporus]
MDTFTLLLRRVDQINTEKLTRIQVTMDLMKMSLINAEQKLVKGYLWFNSETTLAAMRENVNEAEPCSYYSYHTLQRLKKTFLYTQRPLTTPFLGIYSL